MQQRRSKKPFVLGLCAVLAAGLIFLLVKEVPAPTVPVEQALPAEAFAPKQ